MFDYFKMLDLVGPDERDDHAAARKFFDTEITPHVDGWWEAEGTPVREVMKKMGALGLL